jgi:uncharacterized membrane protein
MPQRYIRWLLAGYWVCALGALGLYLIWPELPQTAPRAQGIAAAILYALFIGGLLAVCAASRAERMWLLMACVIGGAAEWVGVHTGWPFGRYEYTAIVVPQFDGWPPLLGLAWAEFAWYTRYLFPVSMPRWLRVVSAASWMTAVDLVMDPVAAGPLHLWQWHDGGAYYGVPWTNYAGWLLVAALIMLVEPRLESAGPESDEDIQTKLARSVARVVGLSILVFFTALALRHGLWVPAAIGALLLVMHYQIRRKTLSRASSA